MSERFLMEFKAAFIGKRVTVTLKSDSQWDGTLQRADEWGLWLQEGEQLIWIPWDGLDSVCAPL